MTRIVASLAVLCAVLLAACAPKAPATQATGSATPASPGAPDEPAGRLRTLSFTKNREMLASPTGFGGSVPRQRAELIPEITALYRGSPFADDYREDRGHGWSWDDLVASRRVTAKTPASCLTCKTPHIVDIFADEGWAYAKKPLSAYTAETHPSISCANCHDPSTNALRVAQPGFREAARRGGIDLDRAPRAAMLSYVCAQCHSEYYFEPGSSRVVLPWDRGTTPQAIYEYYAAKPGGFEADYRNPGSGVALLKAQHPDYEAWAGGVHASAGVTCSTCHMPRVTDEGVTYTSHWVTSPLRRTGQACLPCHKGKNEEWILRRVRYIQDSVFALQRGAAQALVRAHEAVAGAAAAGVTSAQLAPVRESLRRAQWYWDFAASENSTGFHDPVMSQNILAQAIGLAGEAVESAWRAAGQPVGAKP
jgi:nitrite reductase (cytochrome c-552)